MDNEAQWDAYGKEYAGETWGPSPTGPAYVVDLEVEEVTDRKYTVDEVASFIEQEGLEYCIMDYIDAYEIEDNVLRGLWLTATHALNAVKEYVNKHVEE